MILNSSAFQIKHVYGTELEPSALAIFTWALVQLPRLSNVSLTQANALTDRWPHPTVIMTGKDGV